MKTMEIPQISQMSKSEKIVFVEELWDEISREEKDIPVPNSHIVELKRRFENYQTHKDALLTLSEIQANIEKRK